MPGREAESCWRANWGGRSRRWAKFRRRISLRANRCWKHLRDDLLNLEVFDSLLEARVLVEDWRREYNHYRPHQSLGYTTPAAFARQWHHQHNHETS
jgi:transposase InsO family protein